MKVSRAWLQKYFDAELPSAEALADALTFHAFEIEEMKGDMLDVKVLPDRACYALSHRGIASEIAAILNVPLKKDPLANVLPEFPKTEKFSVRVEDSLRCLRYMAATVKGVKVGPSPAWLKEALESVGQRSINNVVDATNYVMLDIGQPLHAFDAGKMSDGFIVRSAKQDEKMTILGGTEVSLPAGALVIADKDSGIPLDIGGVKGGAAAELTEATTDLVIEAANFDAVTIRKTAQALKLFTDASARFQNRVSPELAAYGMRDVLALITEIAGGTVDGLVDVYPLKSSMPTVSASGSMIARKLGRPLSDDEVEGVLKRLSLPYARVNDTFAVTPPFYRGDINLPEDLVEEVGRILGYDGVPATPLPQNDDKPDQRIYRGIERVKDLLVERGFTEISTPSFGAEGDILLANPLQLDRPWLRAALAKNMQDALTRGMQSAPRVLGPVRSVRLFELGIVFNADAERLALCIGYAPLSGKREQVLAETADALSDLLGTKLSVQGDILEFALDPAALTKLGEGYELSAPKFEKYVPFSAYPFALRDIALWTPAGTSASEAQELIEKEAGELLLRIDLFDTFEKDGKVSYAFRLVFESAEKTLADTDIDPVMARVTAAANAKDGWSVR